MRGSPDIAQWTYFHSQNHTVLLNFSYNSAEFHISFILLPYRFAVELFIWRMSAFCVPFNI